MPANLKERRSAAADQPPQSRKRKSVACQRCHTLKIKCSGEQPCARCQRAGRSSACSFPTRDRKVKVAKRLGGHSPSTAREPERYEITDVGAGGFISYLELVVAENNRLSDRLASLQELPEGSGSTNTPQDGGDLDVRNPLIGERAWFQSYGSSVSPIYIGESACSAFSSRLRQFLTGESHASHMARVEYTKESKLLALGKEPIRWPELAHAQLLARVALNHVSKEYHVVLEKPSLDNLEILYRNEGHDDPTSTAKYFALFALGEAYSSKASRPDQLTGAVYFAQALQLSHIRPERPSISNIETLLLLALYSFFLDRRHSGYAMISDAARYGITIGLHHNVSKAQLPDEIEREHRVRLWWTIYILDREWSAKLGFPIQLLDKDVYITMPSEAVPWQPGSTQIFKGTDYLIAKIYLARIMGEIVTNLYTLGEFGESFLRRVQKLLRRLQEWVQSLPSAVKLQQVSPTEKVILLRLSLNQAIILSTRPALFLLLTQMAKSEDSHKESTSNSSDLSLSIRAVLSSLGEACIHAARDSYSVITEQWIDGRVPVLNYIYAHRLFSVSLVLSASSVINRDGRHSERASDDNHCNPHMDTDFGGIRTIVGILRTMRESGNLTASEYLRNLESLLFALNNYRTRSTLNPQVAHATDSEVGGIGIATPSNIETTLRAITAALEKLDSSIAPFPSMSANSTSSAHLTATTAATNSLPFQAPTTEPTAQQPTSQNFLFSQDVDNEMTLGPQQRAAVNNYYESLEDALINWDTLGPLWGE